MIPNFVTHNLHSPGKEGHSRYFICTEKIKLSIDNLSLFPGRGQPIPDFRLKFLSPLPHLRSKRFENKILQQAVITPPSTLSLRLVCSCYGFSIESLHVNFMGAPESKTKADRLSRYTHILLAEMNGNSVTVLICFYCRLHMVDITNTHRDRMFHILEVLE